MKILKKIGKIFTNKPLTGEQLFLRYAFPCAESRCINGHIDNTHFARLENLVKTCENPKRQLLRFCFPHAYRRHREFAQSLDSDSSRWHPEIVSTFWRHHHGHTGDCRVLPAIVAAITQPVIIIVTADGKTFPTINLYSLPLNKGDLVYLHLRVIIEKA